MFDSNEISLMFVFSGRPCTKLFAASMVGFMNLLIEPDVSMTRTTFTGAVCRFMSSTSARFPPSVMVMFSFSGNTSRLNGSFIRMETSAVSPLSTLLCMVIEPWFVSKSPKMDSKDEYVDLNSSGRTTSVNSPLLTGTMRMPPAPSPGRAALML